MSLHNIWNSRQIAADIKQKLELNKRSFIEESAVFILSYQTNGNHVTELSTVRHAISERHWKSTFNFNEIINNYGLKQKNVFQIVIFISHFSYKFENIFKEWSQEVQVEITVAKVGCWNFLPQLFYQVASVSLSIT